MFSDRPLNYLSDKISKAYGEYVIMSLRYKGGIMIKLKKEDQFDSGLNSSEEVTTSKGGLTRGRPTKIITTQIKSKMTIDGPRPA